MITLAPIATFSARNVYETNNDNYVSDLPTEDTLNGGALGYLRIMAWDIYNPMIGWNLASLPTDPISSCSLKIKVLGASSSANITTKSFQISSLVDTFYEGNGNFTAYVANASDYKYKRYNSVYWLGNSSNRAVDICKGNNNSRINSTSITNMTTLDEVRSIPLDIAIMQDIVNKTAYGLAFSDPSGVGGSYYFRSKDQANDTHPALIINTYTLNNPTSSPCSLVFSVGTSTNDFKTSSPTISISSGTATFSIAQTNDSLGVGDEVTFGTGAKVYLMRKSSATQWRGTSAAGKWPDGGSNEPGISIKRAFNSLNAAMNGTSPLAGDATHLNGKNLTSKDTKLYIACYGDGEDATGVSIPSGTWTVDATRYITICTPANISTECNTSQRHPGKWTTGKYVLSSSSGGTLYTYPNYTVIDGLQLSNSTTTSYNVTGYAYGSYYTIKNCIIKGGLAGYYIGGWSNYVTVCNNIVYDCYGDGIWLNGDASDGYHKAYNNTVYHCNIAEANYYDGIKVCGLGSLSTNNISMNNHSGTSYKRDFVVAFDAAQ